MKLIHFKPIDGIKKLYTLNMGFDSGSNILSGTVGTHCAIGDVVRDFSIDLSEWKGKILEVQIRPSSADRYSVVYFDSGKNYADGNGMPDYTHYGRNLRSLFKVCVHENVSESTILISEPHESIEGFDCICRDLEDPNMRMYLLSEEDPVAREILIRRAIKSDLLGAIDQRDSVAYLEAQVDLLTRLCLKLAEGRSDEELSALRVADQYSVLDIKNTDKILREFTEKKSLVRKEQQKYYDLMDVD